jgi:hypothetical protein
VKPSDIEVFEAWTNGESMGSLAKRYKTDKQKIRGIVNRVGNESWERGSTVVHKLSDEAAIVGRAREKE